MAGNSNSGRKRKYDYQLLAEIAGEMPGISQTEMARQYHVRTRVAITPQAVHYIVTAHPELFRGTQIKGKRTSG